MSKNLPIIENLKEFRNVITSLYNIIHAEQEKLRIEYRRLGIDVPDRISLESLDLNRYRKEMLQVHKTLQWQGHKIYLSEKEARISRIVAIAGICEMVKEEYTGGFWNLYRNIIGFNSDPFVYDWIWERGFRDAGIELVRTERREFVQTLILESGIPKNRTSDIITFFGILWRYLREYDVFEVIRNIENELDFTHIPKNDRKTLVSLASSAAEYSKAFALAISRLRKIFVYIEDSPEIIGKDISHWSEIIFKETGVNPLTILRNETQLKKLYSRLLGKVTVEKLRKILSAKPPGSVVLVPDGRKIRNDRYEYVFYGEHFIDGAVFTCVPDTGLDLEFLSRLSTERPFRLSGTILVRTKKKLNVFINGSLKNDAIRPLWINNKLFGEIFYYKPWPADLIELKSSEGFLISQFTGSEGISCNPYLHYSYKKGHFLTVRTNHIRFFSPADREKEIQFSCNVDSKPLYIGKLDRRGRASCALRIVSLNSPTPGEIRYSVIDSECCENIETKNGFSKKSFVLEEIMLFSPYSHRQIYPRKKEKPYLFGSQRFSMYIKNGEMSDSISLENIDIIDKSTSGEYIVLMLEWKLQTLPCRISAGIKEKLVWIFEKCLNFNLYVNPISNKFPEHVFFSVFQRKRLSDFNLVLYPMPHEEIVDLLFWNIIVNDSEPIKIFLKHCNSFSKEKSLDIPGEILEKMLKKFWQFNERNNAKIEISLCSADEVFTSRVFFVFPDLRVEMPHSVREGEEFVLKIHLGNLGVHDLLMKNQLGKSKIKIRIKKTENEWKLNPINFEARLELDHLGTHLDFKASPHYHGVRFGNREKGKIEVVREILKRELKPYDLLIVCQNCSKPVILVNKVKADVIIRNYNNGLWVLALTSLPGVLYSENLIQINTGPVVKEFKIKYRLALLKLSVDEFAFDNMITGISSFRGPIGSEIELRAYGITKNNEIVMINNCTLKPSGIEVNDQPFSISVGEVQNLKDFIDYFKIVAFLKETNSEHEYGENWIVKKDIEIIESGTEFTVQKIKELISENRPFAAKKIFEQASKKGNFEKMGRIEQEINLSIMNNSINKIIVDVRKVLKDEYLFEV
jgi:hypothetical protein